jgi:hypothetical protein
MIHNLELCCKRNDGCHAHASVGMFSVYCLCCYSWPSVLGHATHHYNPSLDKIYLSLRRLITVLVLAFLPMVFFGCTRESSGFIRLVTLNSEQQIMEQDFSRAWCSYDARGQAVCILVSEQSISVPSGSRNVRQTLVLRTFWLPRKGITPVSDSATNMNLDMLIEVGSEAGLYRGAGFALVDEINSRHDFDINIRSATIKIYQQTTGFEPSFKAADVVGKAKVIYQPLMVDKQLAEFESKCRTLGKR